MNFECGAMAERIQQYSSSSLFPAICFGSFIRQTTRNLDDNNVYCAM